MQILMKVYEHPQIQTIKTQELIDFKVQIEEDINGFPIANFTIPSIEIEEYNMVELYEITNTDTLIFSGYVYRVAPVRKQF